MPWITVLGNGSWEHVYDREWVPGLEQPPGDAPRDEDGLPQRGRWRYKTVSVSGTREVDEEAAAAAALYLDEHPVSAEWLIVTDREPTLVDPSKEGPLTLEDLRMGTKLRVVTGDEPEEPEEEEEFEVPDDAPTLDYACEYCSYKGPHPADVARHFEFEHSLRHEKELREMQAAALEAEREEEEARRVKATDPKALPPHEREID